MSDNKDWFQSSGVPSFAQMLKKNLSNSTFFYNSESSFRIFIIRGSQCVEFRASKFIQITESLLSKIDLLNPNVLCPKKIPKKFIMQYKGGEINPVSALPQFAQMQHVKLGLQETVATGNAMGPQFVFCAVVDGIRYKTELGQNKKESLSNAAKITLGELLQVDDPEPRNVETSALKV